MISHIAGISIKETGPIRLINFPSGVEMPMRTNQGFLVYRIIGMTTSQDEKREFLLIIMNEAESKNDGDIKFAVWREGEIAEYLPKEIKTLLLVLKHALSKNS